MVPWETEGEAGGEGTGSGGPGDARRLCPRTRAASRPASQRLPEGHAASAALAPSTAGGERFGIAGCSSPRSGNRRAARPAARCGGRHSWFPVNHRTPWDEIQSFHQVEKTHGVLLTAAPPRCPSAPVPAPCLRGEKAQPILAPPSQPQTLTGPSCPQPGGELGGGSHFSPASRNPLCRHIVSFAFTPEPLERVQGASTALALRSLQDSPSSPSPRPGAAPAQAAQPSASVSPRGEGSPLQPIPAVSKQLLMDAARTAHD